MAHNKSPSEFKKNYKNRKRGEVAVVLEILSHKEYEKRFGYK